MMRTPEQVLEYLRQLKEKLTPSLQKKVGNVLFGDDDDIAKLQGVKIPKDDVAEPNTKWESELYRKIQYWTNSSQGSLAKYFKKNKELLDQLAKEFPEVLKPPIGETAYRGTTIAVNSLELAFKKKKFEVIKIKGREVFRFKNLGYSPNNPAQSWTVDPKVAFRFKGTSDNIDYVQVIYSTKVNKDFIFNPQLMDIIFKGSEKETVRIGGKGTFEALVDTPIIYNPWVLEPRNNFIHKIPSAKPYFKPMILKYNKMVDAANKRLDYEGYTHAGSIEAIIKADDQEEIPQGFSLYKEYTAAVKKYMKAVKNK
jgi:hypothetical protein